METKRTRTVCTGCHQRCGAVVYAEGNRIVRIEGDPDSPYSKGAFCGSGITQRFIHEDAKRVAKPLRRAGARGEGKWEEIGWDEALDLLESNTKRIREEYGPEAIVVSQGTSRTSNDWGQRLKATIGNKGWGLSPLHVCLIPNIMPHALTLGAGQMQGADVANAKTIVLWGISAISILSEIKDIQKNRDENGAKVIVIDPRYSDLAKDADLFLQIRPGSDGALALGLMNVIIREKLYDVDFIDKWTYGFDELAEMVSEWTPEKTSQVTWIPAEQIVAAARMMGGEKPTTLYPMLGPSCMHTNAVQSGRALTCLTGLLGPVDVPGGFMYIPGAGPATNPELTLIPPDWDFNKPEAKLIGSEKFPAFAAFGNANVPYDTFEAVITQKPWPIKMMVLVANDALNCYEAPQKTAEALKSPNLEFIAVKDFYLTPTAQLADLVLPSSDWSERDTIDEEMFRGRIISSPRAVDPPGECWDDWKFYLEWGKRLDPELWPWADEREMVLWRIKLYHGIDLTWDEYVERAYIDTPASLSAAEFKKYETGKLRPDGQPGFMTPSGRIEFFCPTMQAFGYEPLPVYHEPKESPYSTPEVAKDYPLILTTGFRLYSFFHSAWTNVPGQRELYPHPFVVMNPADAQDADIVDGDWVEISSPRGAIMAKAEVSREVGQGVVALPRPGWRSGCEELGLPGYDWQDVCINNLIPGGGDSTDPGFGTAPMRSTLCAIRKMEG
ncbi:molybdopterin-containing oxidoreductase family protein [Gordonibacter urolithinfaciens]|uniref:molybdopterin-containing oxidoreductase family protein n=1 Tax=Gordonibacter urolithinfaciens TaxID=1335613 RepID=UPI0034B00B89